jgi:hypothetical protein
MSLSTYFEEFLSILEEEGGEQKKAHQEVGDAREERPRDFLQSDQPPKLRIRAPNPMQLATMIKTCTAK